MFQLFLLTFSLLFATVSIVQAELYDHPIDDPIAATILSTPPQARASLPQTIRVKQYQTIDWQCAVNKATIN